MRLTSLSPEVLPTSLVDALRTLGIVSDADLFFSATTLEVWRKLPPDLLPLLEFERCVKAVMLLCAVPGSVATEVYGRPAPNQSEPETFTGVGDLDNLLGTTLQDSVVEISGRHGSGAAVWLFFLGYPFSDSNICALTTGRTPRPSPCRLRAITCLGTRTRPRCGSTRLGTFLPRKRISSSDQQNHTRFVFRAKCLSSCSVNDW